MRNRAIQVDLESKEKENTHPEIVPEISACCFKVFP